MPMEDSHAEGDLSQALLGQLKKVLAEKTVIGRPVTVGEISLVPVMTCSLGFGSGVLAQASHSAAGYSRITPAAILIFKDESLTVIHLEGSTVRVLPVELDH